MLLFIIFLVVVFVIWINWHSTNVMQQCENYMNLIDVDNVKNVNKIPDFISFLEKNWTKIHKKTHSNKLYQDKIGQFLAALSVFKESDIYEKRDLIYKKQVCNVLTHTIKDKNLKKQVITEIKNYSKYIPEIANNEEDHFTRNLLNHYVHKGSPVEGEHIEIEYPDVFKNINSLCLKYLTDNQHTTDLILNGLHRIGKDFANGHDFCAVVNDIITDIYPKEPMTILEYLKNKKVINSEQAENYKNQYDEYERILKNNYKKDEIWKKRDKLQQELYYEYICYIIKNGDADEYIKLSEKLDRLLFRVHSPKTWRDDDWLKAHKKVLDARVYGINLLLLFYPKDFKNEFLDNDEKVSADYVLKFKQDIDTILSAYYPVPNFLNHAKEILDAYITGNTPLEKLSYDATWHNDYERKLDEIQLLTLSPYEIFGYTVGYLTRCVTTGGRPIKKYLPIKDSALIAYLDSLGIDDACELYTRIDYLRTDIYRSY